MLSLARLLMSLSCIVAVAVPATAAGMRGMTVADEPVARCLHVGEAGHDCHAGTVAQTQGSCDDCSACTSHCTPALISAPGHLPAAGGSGLTGAAPPRLAGITAVPERKPPRL